MRIAILGWGSLIWDPRELKFRGRWYRRGPQLPIEFSRISQDGRVTLVIDPEHGCMVPTRFAFSTCETVADAIQNLHEREKCPPKKIGSTIVALEDDPQSWAMQQHPKQCEVIRAWAIENRMAAVIWTALEPNFAERLKDYLPELPPANHRFSKENAVALLKARAAAIQYVKRAPEEIVTNVRTLWQSNVVAKKRQRTQR